jgi:uncharacterized protein YheU (UPF0270 family)
LDTTVTVFNFEVDSLHNYFVGKTCVLVHNADDELDENGEAIIIFNQPSNANSDAVKKKLAALYKAAAEGKAKVVHNVKRDGKAQKKARQEGLINNGEDADHSLDLQFGGTDTGDNIQSLDQTVNRSIGSQGKIVKKIPNGTKIKSFKIK